MQSIHSKYTALALDFMAVWSCLSVLSSYDRKQERETTVLVPFPAMKG